MRPIGFPQQNKVLGIPVDWDNKKGECEPLPVYTNDWQVISCWKMSFKERLKALIFGKVWLYVATARHTQQPVAFHVGRSAFDDV